MKYYLILVLLCLLCLSTELAAQKDTTRKDTLSYEQIRGQSGLDPVIIHSKYIFTSYINDLEGSSCVITNTAGILLVVKKWGLSLESSVVSVKSKSTGEGFSSGIGDMKFTLSYKLHTKGKHSLAVAGKLGFPTGKAGFGSQYLSLTPAITYIFAPKPSIILAVQPQYSFHLFKNALYPDLSLLTVKLLFAKFNKSGFIYGVELKPIVNFTASYFNLFISPFLSHSLGGGFNILVLCDIPATGATIKKGATYQLGFNRNF